MQIDICVGTICLYHQERHIKNSFVPGIFVIINFWNPFILLGKSGIMDIAAENIQTGNCIKCGIKITK